MTKLKLNGLFLLQASRDCKCPPNLLQAELKRGYVYHSWLNRFNEAAPNLQTLQLEMSPSADDANARLPLNPFTNLR